MAWTRQVFQMNKPASILVAGRATVDLIMEIDHFSDRGEKFRANDCRFGALVGIGNWVIFLKREWSTESRELKVKKTGLPHSILAVKLLYHKVNKVILVQYN